jgi:hypothetical protein
MTFKMTYSGKGSGSRAGKTYEGDVGVVESQRDLLIDYRNDGRPHDAELEWEIRLYEFILTHADPQGAAKAYMDARYPDDGPMVWSKRDVVAMLGWIVP